MQIEFILLIILFRYLQVDIKTKTDFPEWKRYFQWGMIASIVFLVIEIVFNFATPVTLWIGQISIFLLIYFSYHRPELEPIKSIIKAILPLAIVRVLKRVTHLISTDFYNNIDGLLDAATGFAILWLIAMFIIDRRQRKALEVEQLKAAEKDKEYQRTQQLKIELEEEVSKRTLELTEQKHSLLNALNDLKSTQAQLIQSEKMASLGELTAGIAHEIQNPLNFVNNFSDVSGELLEEVKKEIESGNKEDALEIISDLEQNLSKISHHGNRASSIVKGMLDHSRTDTGEKVLTDINALCDEYMRLSYHGLRAKDKTFNADFTLDLEEELPQIKVTPQELGRVLLNILNNAFYTVNKKNKAGEYADDKPVVKISTVSNDDKVVITIGDNGQGMNQETIDKIFQPFFTTKPTGQGTGLGMSISYDIVTKGHGGSLEVNSVEREGTEFIIILPKVQ